MQSSLLALALANKFFPDPLVGVPPAVSVCELFLLLSHNLPNFNKKGSSVHVAPACAGSGVLNSRSLLHRLGQGSQILSRHEREREGVRDTPSWVAGPRVGAGGGVVAMATVGVEAARAAARMRSR
jgi:hypothetical protein